MKKRRRIELHIERREISVYAGLPPMDGQPPNLPMLQESARAQGEDGGCPRCGARDLLSIADAVACAGRGLDALNQGMRDGSIHFHCSPSGEWWVCARTLGPVLKGLGEG